MARPLTLLARARAEKDWTLEELAERAGVGKNAANDAERAVRWPLTSTLVKLCRALELELDEVWADLQARLPEDGRVQRGPRRRRTDREIPTPEPEEQVS